MEIIQPLSKDTLLYKSDKISGGGFPYDEEWERYKHLVVYPIKLDISKVSPEIMDAVMEDTVGKIRDGTITRNKIHTNVFI
jgi:hypothetical protein